MLQFTRIKCLSRGVVNLVRLVFGHGGVGWGLDVDWSSDVAWDLELGRGLGVGRRFEKLDVDLERWRLIGTFGLGIGRRLGVRCRSGSWKLIGSWTSLGAWIS
jgi:hypothetical protein